MTADATDGIAATGDATWDITGESITDLAISDSDIRAVIGVTTTSITTEL
jgi:hypothetical protein